MRGDVELHVRAADFAAHGHTADARYNRVVLHVVFDGGGRSETQLASGRRVPVVALLPWLARRARELEGWLERPTLWREPCHDAAARLGREQLLEFLNDLGDQRFRAREETLAGLIDSRGPGEALYRSLLEGLSYGGDRRLPEVAAALPYRALASRLEAATEREREGLAERLLCSALPPEVPRSGRRPANSPERRLAGLARLLARHHPLEDAGRGIASSAPRDLVASWSAPPHIGRSRAIELLTNAVLPWAAARAERLGRRDEAGACRAAFEALPVPSRYGVLAFLEANLRDRDGRLPLNARRQQGLLTLYKTECSTGGCGRCRLS
jgi:hypothetical protein